MFAMSIAYMVFIRLIELVEIWFNKQSDSNLPKKP